MKILLIYCIFVVEFRKLYSLQHRYELRDERCDVIFNKEFLYNITLKCYKVGRHELYMNVSWNLNITLDSDRVASLHLIGYQFKSNEYKKGPIEMRLGLCSTLERNDFGIPSIFSNSNFKCPFRKDHYFYAYKIRPNASTLPPFIPDGRWKLEIKLMYLNKFEISNSRWYTEVTYPIRCPPACRND